MANKKHAAEELPLQASQDLVVIETTPAVIDFDFERLKKRLEEELAKYRLAVTADTVAPAKKSATELNKLKQEMDSHIKEKINEASGPIASMRPQHDAAENILRSPNSRRASL